MKHTPGPWTVDKVGYVNFAPNDVYNKDEFICTYSKEKEDYDALTTEDARLVAAAPELLEACIAAIEYDKAIRRNVSNGDFELDPRAAITEGVDLDALYWDWINKAANAINRVEGK